jgi:hypothetical protein
MNARSLWLDKDKKDSKNDSLNDWRMFEFNQITIFNIKRNINLRKIEIESFIDFGNLEELNLEENKLTLTVLLRP